MLQWKRISLLGSAAALTLCFGAGPAKAVESDAAPQLEEITVTATKREVSSQQVAGGITALSGSALQAQGIENFDDLVRTVPGVISSGASNANKFVIRGIETSNTTSSSGEQKLVTIYLDDLPLTSFSIVTPDVQPYDISRVEVLRGPQGTLFGGGSMAGAIRYITNKPDDTGYHASADLDLGGSEGGSYRERISFMTNLPLIDDKLALRLVGTFRNQDGYIDQVNPYLKNTNSEQDWGMRAALRWRASDRFTATVTFTNDRNHSGDGGVYDASLGLHKSNFDDPFVLDTGLTTVNGLLEYSLDFADLTSSTTYAHAPIAWHLDLDGVDSRLHYYEQSPTDSVIQEFRLVSKSGGPFEWVAGAYYARQDSAFAGAVYISQQLAQALNITGGLSRLSPGIEGSNSIIDRINFEAAVFGEASYQISHSLKFTAGLRVSDTAFDNDTLASGFNSTNFYAAVFGGGNTTLTYVPTPTSVNDTGAKVKVTPKFELQWMIDPDKMLYALVAEGYRRAQPNTDYGRSLLNPNDPVIIPQVTAGDELWNYELGAKTLWLDGRVRANVAAYYIDWSPMQVPLVRSSDSNPYVGLVGGSHSIGLETELEASITRAFDIGANLTLNHAKVTSLTDSEALQSGAVLGAPLSTPKVKVGGFVKYSHDLGEFGTLYGRVDVQHVGSYPNSFPNAPATGTPNPTYAVVPSYENVNVQVGVDRAKMGASLYVENLFDNDTPIFIDSANYSHNQYATLRPRTFGIRLSYRY
jgi:iron complex outermembrane receptor protein